MDGANSRAGLDDQRSGPGEYHNGAGDLAALELVVKNQRLPLPLVKSSLTVSTVLNIIYVFNSFPIIWTMTKGDPANHTDTLVSTLPASASSSCPAGGSPA